MLFCYHFVRYALFSNGACGLHSAPRSYPRAPCVAPAESKPPVQRYAIQHCIEIKKWEHTVLPYGRKNPLPFPFSKRSPVSGLRQIRNKGNEIHKGGNLGVHPCAPARHQRRFRSLRKRPASPILLRPDSLIRLQRLRHIQYPLVRAAAKPQLDVLLRHDKRPVYQ